MLTVFINEPQDLTGKTHKILQDAGIKVILGRPAWIRQRQPYSEDEMTSLGKDMDGLMGASKDTYTRKVIESAPKLRIISKFGVGVENVDIEAANNMGILVTNTPVEENVLGPAEQAITLILNLAKKVKSNDLLVRGGGWRGYGTLTTLVAGKTVGIVGLGRVGSKVAELLAPWKVKILVYDPYITDERTTLLCVQRVSSLNEILTQSDIITLHLVVTKDTIKMIGEKELKMMKKTAFLINTSRGALIDEVALIQALKERWIQGAGLDVTDPEPPKLDNQLFSLENVVLSPHVGGWTPEALEAVCRTATENVISAFRGEVPRFVVNPQALSKWKERFHM